MNLSCSQYRDLSSKVSCLTQVLPDPTCSGIAKIGEFCCVNTFKDDCDLPAICGFSSQSSTEEQRMLEMISRPESWQDCVPFNNVFPHLYNVSNRVYRFIDGHTGTSNHDDPNAKSNLSIINLSQCYEGLCRKSSVCSLNATALDLCSAQGLSQNNSVTEQRLRVQCKAAICQVSKANPDIAGIGLYVSYWLQIALFFIIVVLCITAFLDKSPSSPTTGPKSSLLQSGFRVALEFQKAQCFFAFAIAINTAYSIDTRGDELKDTDRNVLAMILGNGIWLITFMLLALIKMRPRHLLSWTVFVFSIAVWLMSLVLVEHVTRTKRASVVNHESVPTCLGHSLSEVCSPFNFFQPASYLATIGIVAFCIACQMLNLGLSKRSVGSRRLSGQDSSIEELMDRVCHPRTYVHVCFLWVASVIVILCGFTSAVWFIAWMVAFVQFRSVVQNDWSFGQIIAVMVWTPVILSLIQLFWKSTVDVWTFLFDLFFYRWRRTGTARTDYRRPRGATHNPF